MGTNNFDRGTLYLGDVAIGTLEDITFTAEFNFSEIENNINLLNEVLEDKLIDGGMVANLLEVNFKRAYRKGRI